MSDTHPQSNNRRAQRLLDVAWRHHCTIKSQVLRGETVWSIYPPGGDSGDESLTLFEGPNHSVEVMADTPNRPWVAITQRDAGHLISEHIFGRQDQWDGFVYDPALGRYIPAENGGAH